MNNVQSLTVNSLVARSAQHMGNKVENELVMIDLESGNYYGLDPIASDIWERMAEPIRVADLCAGLRERYAVEEDRCQRDVLALLDQMKDNNMLSVVDEA